MRITIDTGILSRERLSLGEFLALLMSFHGIDYMKAIGSLDERKLASRNCQDAASIVLSGNTKNLVARIIEESDEEVRATGIDYYSLASRMQEEYPDGIKPGTTYRWRGDNGIIALKLMTLVSRHGFTFNEEEAVRAVMEYVMSFSEGRTRMRLLSNFILKRGRGDEVCSDFMTIIQNRRDNEDNDRRESVPEAQD